MSIYLVTYTIYNDKTRTARNQFNEFLEKMKSTSFLETTVFIPYKGNSYELCKLLYNEFKRIVNEQYFTRVPTIEIGVFSVSKNSFISSDDDLFPVEEWYENNKF